jgi:hypothetical protein
VLTFGNDESDISDKVIGTVSLLIAYIGTCDISATIREIIEINDTYKHPFYELVNIMHQRLQI